MRQEHNRYRRYNPLATPTRDIIRTPLLINAED